MYSVRGILEWELYQQTWGSSTCRSEIAPPSQMTRLAGQPDDSIQSDDVGFWSVPVSWLNTYLSDPPLGQFLGLLEYLFN